MKPIYPIRAVNETGDTTIDVQRIQVPDSAITAGSGVVSLATATGDVTGPSSATDNAITRFNGTTGKVVQNSAAFVDDNGNVYAPNVAGGSVSVATAAGTTTLTVASKGTQVFTGVTTQTVVLPVVTTLPQIGFGYHIINDSTGALTVNSSGANLVQTIPAGGRALITCILLTGTSAASWASTFTNAATSAGALSGATIATAAANTNDLGLANTAFVQGQGQGYLVYDATLTQTSTNAPVATVGQNNIGQTMTWGYTSTGVYTVTAGAAAFTANKTQIFIGSGNSASILVSAVRTSTTVITVNTFQTDGVAPEDAKMTETAIRIVVFP